MDQEEYQRQYDEAAAALDVEAQASTARGADGRFAKVEAKVEAKEATPQPTPEPTPAPTPAPKQDEKPDELAELRARVEKAEKIAKDNQAWATRLAQERAQEKREREQREREANKPAILDANPGLDEAIRYVAQAPAQQQTETPDEKQAKWAAAVETAHPGIFTSALDPELEQALVARLSALDEASKQDPLVAIREITAEKLAYGERQVGKRFAAEAAKLKEKSAMSVPGAGAGAGPKGPVVDAQLAEVDRIRNMSDADFQREVRRVKGL